MKFVLVIFLVLVLLIILKIMIFDKLTELKGVRYHLKVGLPLANKIRKVELKAFKIENKTEEPNFRIVNGFVAYLGQLPYQAGIIADLNNNKGQSVCGGSLLNSNRVLTAAHCWWDGDIQASKFTIVLGSTTLFYGGTRIQTTHVLLHKYWNPSSSQNDIAMVYLPSEVQFSDVISPIDLPRADAEDFTGAMAVTSGYGLTSDEDMFNDKTTLRYVVLKVISNARCHFEYKNQITESNICTMGSGGRNTCIGDAGGPLVIKKASPILVGVNSFRSIHSCQIGLATIYTRVTSYIDWINKVM